FSLTASRVFRGSGTFGDSSLDIVPLEKTHAGTGSPGMAAAAAAPDSMLTRQSGKYPDARIHAILISARWRATAGANPPLPSQRIVRHVPAGEGERNGICHVR